MRRQHHAGADHRDVAESLNNLALLYQERGRYPMAEKLMREAIAIQRAVTDDSGTELASLLANLGILLTEVGNWTDAEPPFREALQLRREALGEDHASGGRQSQRPGRLSRHPGRPRFRREHAARGVGDAAAQPRQKPPDAGGEHQQPRPAAAREEETSPAPRRSTAKPISIREKQLGRDHRLVAIHVHNLGRCCRRRASWRRRRCSCATPWPSASRCSARSTTTSASRTWRWATCWWRRAGPPRPSRCCARASRCSAPRCRRTIGASPRRRAPWAAVSSLLGRYREAEPLLLSSYENLSAKRGPDHRRTQHALDHLIELYDTTDRDRRGGRPAAQAGRRLAGLLTDR